MDGAKRKMRLFTYLFLATLALSIFATESVAATAAQKREKRNRFALFAECRPMGLIVESLPSDAEKIGLTEESIQAAVESRLRSARLYSSRLVRHYLYINVNVVGRAYAISVQFNKEVRDLFSKINYLTATWNIGSTGTHGNSAAYILSNISQQLDRFLVEFLRVNEKACQKR